MLRAQDACRAMSLRSTNINIEEGEKGNHLFILPEIRVTKYYYVQDCAYLMSNTMVYFQSKYSFFLVLKVHFFIDWTLFNFVFQFRQILSARSHIETEGHFYYK